MALLAAVLLAVTLSPPFGEAEARALTIRPDFTFEVYVEVSGAPTTVLARLVGLGGELDPVLMSDLGDGRYGAVVELTRAENLSVGFEVIREGQSILSELATLEELGIDPAVFTSPEATPVADDPSPSYAWLLVAVAAAILALLLLGIWTFGGSKRPAESETPQSEPTQPEATQTEATQTEAT
jgi:hypothetical protein